MIVPCFSENVNFRNETSERLQIFQETFRNPDYDNIENFGKDEMMKKMKRWTSLLLVLAMAAAALSGCGQTEQTTSSDAAQVEGTAIELSDDGIMVNGEAAGTDSTATVYVANDIVYYEAGKDFTYGEGTEADAHSTEEAAAHTVVHITQPGTYTVSGTLSQGQIAVDLGEDAEETPEAVVTLILNGVDITCTVAPAVIFYNVYECGSADTETATKDVDTSAAGANVVIADGTTNTVNGSYVARIYKPDSVELSEDGTEVADAKKLHKYDAAFYSKMSMNVAGGEEGTGILNIDAANEGLDTELHLTINGGNINIESGNDGINTNEDGVSVTTINGGNLTIAVTGETGEGDGIDSNGWLVINGGSVVAAACDNSADSGVDSDMGIHINGGTVMATGHMLDRIEDGGQNYAVFGFTQVQSGDDVVSLRNEADEELMALWPINDYSILIYSSPELAAGDYTLWSNKTQLAGSAGGGMMGGPGMGGGMRPEGMTPPDGQELPEMPEGMEFPEGMEPPEMPEGFDPAQRPEATERPEGSQRPEGEFQPQLNEDGTITLPDGTTVDPSERMPMDGPFGGGFRGQGGEVDGESTTTFAITDGGTMFSRVAAAG